MSIIQFTYLILKFKLLNSQPYLPSMKFFYNFLDSLFQEILISNYNHSIILKVIKLNTRWNYSHYYNFTYLMCTIYSLFIFNNTGWNYGHYHITYLM